MIDETTKYVERRNLDKVEQLREADKPKPPRKEGKSTFDEMLEQGRMMQQGAIETKTQTKTATQQAVQELEKRQERQKDSSKDKEKEEDQRQESREQRSETEIGGKKVVGKAGLKQHQGESGGGGFEGSGSGAKKGNRSVSNLKKWNLGEAQAPLGNTQFGKAFQSALGKTAHPIPRHLTQQVLNQIVRYVRIGLNKEGNRELELDLHQNVFKGLRLRLSANHGKVSIHFLTANIEVRELFKRETSKIQERLEEKGIAVQEIQVT